MISILFSQLFQRRLVTWIYFLHDIPKVNFWRVFYSVNLLNKRIEILFDVIPNLTFYTFIFKIKFSLWIKILILGGIVLRKVNCVGRIYQPTKSGCCILWSERNSTQTWAFVRLRVCSLPPCSGGLFL